MLAPQVGYGDIEPQTPGAKMFTAFFLLFGITILGGCLGIVIGLVEDRANRKQAAERRQQEIKMWQEDSLREDTPRHGCRGLWHRVPPVIKAIGRVRSVRVWGL